MSNAYAAIGGSARKIAKIYDVDSGMTRKISKGYTVLGGVTRKFFAESAGEAVSFDGEHTVSELAVDGVVYDLWTLTQSGTLTVGSDVQYWMCGGGGNGRAGYYSGSMNVIYSGGGGGGGYIASGTLPAGTHTVVIGPAGGNTSIGDIVAAAGVKPAKYEGGAGGSGGGAGAYSYINTLADVGEGSGLSMYPFGATSMKAHCAGGGGGALYTKNTYKSSTGGAGGTNGGSGSVGEVFAAIGGTTAPSSLRREGGAGGEYGGGSGGYIRYQNSSPGRGSGSDASFYGGGGGGGGTIMGLGVSSTGGSGYQGVVYILVPKAA